MLTSRQCGCICDPNHQDNVVVYVILASRQCDYICDANIKTMWLYMWLMLTSRQCGCICDANIKQSS